MKNIILLACFSLLLASMASAEIIVSQTSSSYNLGDMLNINVTVFSSSNSNGFLDINLICNNEETNIYRAPLTISTGGKKIIENSLLLTSSSISVSSSLSDCLISSCP